VRGRQLALAALTALLLGACDPSDGPDWVLSPPGGAPVQDIDEARYLGLRKGWHYTYERAGTTYKRDRLTLDVTRRSTFFGRTTFEIQQAVGTRMPKPASRVLTSDGLYVADLRLIPLPLNLHQPWTLSSRSGNFQLAAEGFADAHTQVGVFKGCLLLVTRKYVAKGALAHKTTAYYAPGWGLVLERTTDAKERETYKKELIKLKRTGEG
jgi:hypothetical protein